MSDVDDDLPSSRPTYQTDADMNVNCDQVLRTAMISIIMFWVLVAVIAGLYDPVDRLFVPPWCKNKPINPFTSLGSVFFL